MTIESELAKISSLLETLVEYATSGGKTAFDVKSPPPSNTVRAEEPKKEEATPKKKRATRKKKTKAETEEKPKSSSSRGDITALMTQLVNRDGDSKKAVAILKECGATRIGALEESDYDTIAERLREELNNG